MSDRPNAALMELHIASKTPAGWENPPLRCLINLIFHSESLAVTGIKALHFHLKDQAGPPITKS